jgi:hypothetical protein
MPRIKLPDKEFQWLPELAYVIGLLATDGCLSSDGRHIVIRSSDFQLLKTFKKCLNLSNKISETFDNGWSENPCYRIQFGDVQFYKWLLKIGLSPAKTYTIGEIKVPDKYFRDFLRGHLDGDGSVWSYRDFYNTYKNPKYIYTRLFVRFISASKLHIKWLRKNINKLIGVNGHVCERMPSQPYQTTSIWEVKFAKKESVKLLNWIYYRRNLPCLTRKKSAAFKALQKISKEKRRKYTRIKNYINKI